ncbi:hypothetical protein [Paraburkholderia dipogonis]|uniref:hypothetical protein n=1 Tax=Paraburkholderia dipogonis TaxID=1211383 RepID=UPI0038BB61CA
MAGGNQTILYDIYAEFYYVTHYSKCYIEGKDLFSPAELAALQTVAAQGGHVNVEPRSPWQLDDAAYFACSVDRYRVRERYADEFGIGQYMILWEIAPGKRMKYGFDMTGPNGTDFAEKFLLPAGGEAETVRAILFTCLRNRKPFDIDEAIEVTRAMRRAGSGYAN